MEGRLHGGNGIAELLAFTPLMDISRECQQTALMSCDLGNSAQERIKQGLQDITPVLPSLIKDGLLMC